MTASAIQMASSSGTKDKIPVEHHILRHAPCGNGGQHKLRCDIHAEEHSAVALVPEAERNEQQSLDQQRRQQGREKLLCVIAPRISGQDRVRGVVVVGKFLPQAVALLHERKAGAVLCRDDDTELVRDAVIAIPEGVIRALYLAVHRRSRTIQHSQMPRSFSACIACRRPKIRYDPASICVSKDGSSPDYQTARPTLRPARADQDNNSARRIFHLDGYSRLWPHVSARRNRQQNDKQREQAENRGPLSFHNYSSLPLYANRNIQRKQKQVTNTIRYDFSSVLLDKSCVCGYNSKVILRKCHEKEGVFLLRLFREGAVGASTSARGKKVALEQDS